MVHTIATSPPSFEQHAKVSPSKLAEVVCEDVFDDISSDEEEPRDRPRRRKGSNNTKTIESKMKQKVVHPKAGISGDIHQVIRSPLHQANQS